jgi:hypothetical protein
MADNQANNNRIVMILAAAVVVLFIAFIAVVVLNANKGSATASGSTSSSTTASSSTGTSTSLPGVASSAAFDPATATKFADTMKPADYVAKYYQSILDKKFDVAFKMQPAASQKGGTVTDFQSTQTMYGMTKFSIFNSTTTATDATVVVSQDLGTNGIWNATWSFVKSGSNWLVKERVVGMGAPTK